MIRKGKFGGKCDFVTARIGYKGECLLRGRNWIFYGFEISTFFSHKLTRFRSRVSSCDICDGTVAAVVLPVHQFRQSVSSLHHSLLVPSQQHYRQKDKRTNLGTLKHRNALLLRGEGSILQKSSSTSFDTVLRFIWVSPEGRQQRGGLVSTQWRVWQVDRAAEESRGHWGTGTVCLCAVCHDYPGETKRLAKVQVGCPKGLHMVTEVLVGFQNILIAENLCMAAMLFLYVLQKGAVLRFVLRLCRIVVTGSPARIQAYCTIKLL